MLSDAKLIMHLLERVIATGMVGGRREAVKLFFSNFCLHLCHCLFRWENFL